MTGVQRLRELAEAAQPGPWVWDEEYVTDDSTLGMGGVACGSLPSGRCNMSAHGDQTSCGHPNPVWFTESRLWNEVMGGDQDEEATGIVCPFCFAVRADEHFDGSRWRILGWRLVPEWGRPS